MILTATPHISEQRDLHTINNHKTNTETMKNHPNSFMLRIVRAKDLQLIFNISERTAYRRLKEYKDYYSVEGEQPKKRIFLFQLSECEGIPIEELVKRMTIKISYKSKDLAA